MIDDVERQKVIKALRSIQSDSNFRNAPKSTAFLQYIVEQTLDNNAHRLKAYTIAVDALNKPETFDPQNDPSVRVMAKRMRDMLTEYYDRSPEHEVVIRMQPGSYVPIFLWKSK